MRQTTRATQIRPDSVPPEVELPPFAGKLLEDFPDGPMPQKEGNETRALIEFLSPSQIMAYQAPKDLVLVGDNHIVRGSVFVIAGPPGVGKSRGAIALAEAGATSREWFGLTVHCKFKTLIIQSENGRFRLRRELSEINEPLLEDSLRICPPPPYGLCFWEQQFRDQLKDFTESYGPQVVLLDPWNAIARDERARDYLETFHVIRDVFPQGEQGPAIGIVAHTRKPTLGERVNGRALLNLLAGSYVLASVPRCVFVMQNASDEVTESRIVWTCCKNNDGELGERSAWIRQNGLFTPAHEFNWASWDQGEKEGAVGIPEVVGILIKNPTGLTQSKLVKEISKRGVSRATAYRRIEEAEKAGRIRCNQETELYVVSR